MRRKNVLSARSNGFMRFLWTEETKTKLNCHIYLAKFENFNLLMNQNLPPIDTNEYELKAVCHSNLDNVGFLYKAIHKFVL